MTENRRKQLRADLEQVHRDVERELEKCRGGEKTVGTLIQLEVIERELRKMIATLDSGVLPPRADRSPGLWHIVTDSWGSRDPLGEKIVAVELSYERL